MPRQSRQPSSAAARSRVARGSIVGPSEAIGKRDEMSENQVSAILAQAIAAEGVDTVFTLMGDANMYWSASMADNQNARLIHARHEHCCVAMDDAYARATGRGGVASVTCGARFVPIRTVDRALDCVREAFYVARAERKPVVLSVPLDLQKEEFPFLPDYTPSTDLMPRPQGLHPDPVVVDEIAAMVAEAERPIVIGGGGRPG